MRAEALGVQRQPGRQVKPNTLCSNLGVLGVIHLWICQQRWVQTRAGLRGAAAAGSAGESGYSVVRPGGGWGHTCWMWRWVQSRLEFVRFSCREGLTWQ